LFCVAEAVPIGIIPGGKSAVRKFLVSDSDNALKNNDVELKKGSKRK
jgi:hypothetical protein